MAEPFDAIGPLLAARLHIGWHRAGIGPPLPAVITDEIERVVSARYDRLRPTPPPPRAISTRARGNCRNRTGPPPSPCAPSSPRHTAGRRMSCSSCRTSPITTSRPRWSPSARSSPTRRFCPQPCAPSPKPGST
ncbi:MAG: hypothetical protein ACRD0P_37220, partial [Stackebrandtia sp.]